MHNPARHVAGVVKNLELGEDNMEMYCTIIIETWVGARTMRKVEWVRNICDDITRIFMIRGFLIFTTLMHIFWCLSMISSFGVQTQTKKNRVEGFLVLFISLF